MHAKYVRCAGQCLLSASHCPSVSSALPSGAATEGSLRGSPFSPTLVLLVGEQKQMWPVLQGSWGTGAVTNEDTPLCFSSPRAVGSATAMHLRQPAHQLCAPQHLPSVLHPLGNTCAASASRLAGRVTACPQVHHAGNSQTI